ncbi:hypothetical protein FS837_005196 [Tulasnella sp. UAMH 9824]|nr:hypothetical protein FS837_005196 [Tulasnella sp. UAMH 9824]
MDFLCPFLAAGYLRMARKKKYHGGGNKNNNQQKSAFPASSWTPSQPGTSQGSQANQADIETRYPLATLIRTPSANNSTQSAPYAGTSYIVYLGPPEQRIISHQINTNPALGRAFSFPTASGRDRFSALSPELLLTIMENLPGEDVFTLRRAVPQILTVLAESKHASKVWNTVRLTAGVPARKGGPACPSPDELTHIRYVLETHCMVLSIVALSSKVYLLTIFAFGLFRITFFRDFAEEHIEIFNGWGHLREAIPWVTADSVPGLVGFGGALVTRKTWADQVARDLRINLNRRSRKQVEKDREIISDRILKDLATSRSFAVRIGRLNPAKISGPLALDRLARQRQKWFTTRLLAMTPMKFILIDIPKLHDPEWGRIMNKKLEPGQEGGANHANSRKEDPEHSHHYVGSLPASVFLKICMFSDIETTMILERTCSAARSILQSSAAETTWRHLRLVGGLEAKYPGWSERQFLKFAFRRLCHCGSEGVTLWTFAMTLCGDCFAKHVTTTDETLSNISKDLKRSMPSLHTEVYAARGWFSVMPDGVRLLSRHYVGAVQDWVSQIPVATREQLPYDFLATYLEQETETFCKIAKTCETWQEKHCSMMRDVRRRRTLAIIRAVQHYKPGFLVTSLIDRDPRWQNLVNQSYPFSEQEWIKRGKKVLEIAKVG